LFFQIRAKCTALESELLTLKRESETLREDATSSRLSADQVAKELAATLAKCAEQSADIKAVSGRIQSLEAARLAAQGKVQPPPPPLLLLLLPASHTPFIFCTRTSIHFNTNALLLR
jgi:hypothetical protein